MNCEKETIYEKLAKIKRSERGIIIKIDKKWYRFVPIKNNGWHSQIMVPIEPLASEPVFYKEKREGIEIICQLFINKD